MIRHRQNHPIICQTNIFLLLHLCGFFLLPSMVVRYQLNYELSLHLSSCHKYILLGSWFVSEITRLTTQCTQHIYLAPICLYQLQLELPVGDHPIEVVISPGLTDHIMTLLVNSNNHHSSSHRRVWKHLSVRQAGRQYHHRHLAHLSPQRTCHLTGNLLTPLRVISTTSSKGACGAGCVLLNYTLLTPSVLTRHEKFFSVSLAVCLRS